MKIDEYSIHARYYPAALSVVPIIIMVAVFENEQLTRLLSNLATVEIAGKFTVGFALFFFQMQLARFIGKEIFEKIIFSDEQRFPTTDYLMPNDSTLSRDFKDSLIGRIKTVLDSPVPGEKELQTDEKAARIAIKDIVGRIRGNVGNTPLVLQRNWEYGFWRNLVGGSVLAMFVSIWGAVTFFGSIIGHLFMVLAVVYGLVLLFSPFFLKRLASLYAHQLFHAFIGDTR